MISAIIIVKNEESDIQKCLSSLSFCSQIVIINDGSEDRTIEFAKKFTSEIYEKKLISFSEQRNFGLSKASNNWVFFIDADEFVSPSLSSEIIEAVKSEKYNGYYVRRKDVFLGREMKYGDLRDVWIMRLVKKDKSRWVNDVHEECKVEGKTSHLNSPLNHSSHSNLTEFVFKLNQYSTLRALELKKKGVKPSFSKMIFLPMLKFIHLYVLKYGFLDGLHGFVHALLMSFYTFLVKAKLYTLNLK